MNKLRLLVTEKCNRNCIGCCNKEWDLKSLPVCLSFEGYDEIILTGGEPIMYGRLSSLINKIRKQNEKAKIFMYTQSNSPYMLLDVLQVIDGITFTVHDNDGLGHFWALEKVLFRFMSHYNLSLKSLRLNVFKGVDDFTPVLNWKVKKDMEWIKNCPLPKDEIFMRL
jgi:hypothetical protein